MTPFENEPELAAALREARPTPRAEFAAWLDDRAAAGFPRDSRRASAVARVRERLASTPPGRRLIAPAGAFAVAAILIATAVVATTENGGPASEENQFAARAGSAGSAGSHPQTEFEGVVPTAPERAATPPGGATADSHATGSFPESSVGVVGSSAENQSAPLGKRPSGPYAAHAGRRDIERSAEIVLGAEPDRVRADAAKVFDAVHATDGIVLNSSIRDGQSGDAGADFELLIPSGKLGNALAAFSAIAEVRSRHEATQDITAPTVGVRERLQDSRAKIEGLLGQLAGADTDAERAAVEAQLRSERARSAALRSRLSALSRRANFSRVSLRIETGAQSSGNDGGRWGIGDGLDDAGRILAIAAGVTAIGLAILAPFALIALLAWLSRRVWLHRARRAALRSS
jgi:hypothetical protein